MVEKLTVYRIICYNLCVPITGDPLPVVLLRFKFHESCHNDTNEWSGRIEMRGALIAPPECVVVEPTGEARNPLFMAAVRG